MSLLTSDVSSPRMSRYEMIFMACSRSSLAASKNSLAKPGLFIVSFEKWAPWNKTKLSHVSTNHCKRTSTMSVPHSVRHQFIYTHAHLHTQKTYNMAYNQDDLNFQQHALSFPPGDVRPVMSPPTYQYTQTSETWRHKGLYIMDKRVFHIPQFLVV